jgi:hypothetical protein
MFDDPLRHLPYPELVEPQFDERDYEIHDSRHVHNAASIGMVNKVERIMLVPLSDDGVPVTRHELGHVKWSPRKLPTVPFDSLILLAVEDARINRALQRQALDCSDERPLREYAFSLAMGDIAKGEYAVFILRCIASIGTDLTQSLAEMARLEAPTLRPLLERLLSMVETGLEQSRLRTRKRIIAASAAAVRIAAAVADELEQAGMLVTPNGQRRLMIEGGFCLSCDARHADAAGVKIPGPRGRLQDREAAKMQIAEPDLSISLVRRRQGEVGRQSVGEGAIVRSANRWFSDRKIFRGRARRTGGTVLIDTSSSMRLTAADVDCIVKSAPTATLVAMYSGQYRRGELRIIARNGRRAAEDQLAPFGPGNLIDLPALEWLAKQPGPRVWLSDARVTGVNDFASRLLARRCRIVCLKHGVRRAETAAQAAAILEGRAQRRLPAMVET